jgi:hypothetical protein
MRIFSTYRIGLIGMVVFQPLLRSASAQETAPHEPGVVYYADASNFKSLAKEAAPASGRARFSAKIKGPHAAVRFPPGQTLQFRLCSADPTRYKLYRLRSTKNSRDVTITKINIWIGGGKSALSESEIPIAVEPADSGCFTLTNKAPLSEGEYAISPAGEESAFAFGVGEVTKPE